jgi:hypothetical protein
MTAVTLLDKARIKLDHGDWWRATTLLSGGVAIGEQSALVTSASVLRCVARAMCAQCVHGDVEAAQNQLDTAVRLLGGCGLLDAEPAVGREEDHLQWAITRLVMREQADLDAVRTIFESLPRGRSELVHACVEFLTWVEHDPFTIRIRENEAELLRVEDDVLERFRTANRADICTRATNLRHFADARRGSVNEKTWRRTGGYPALRELALRELAQEELSRGRAYFPVRLGRRRAWEFARRWMDDIDE